jgi:glutamate carboxypeptidase
MMDEIVIDRVNSYLHGQKEEMFDFLKHLVLEETPSTDPSAHSGIIDFLKGAFGSIGYSIYSFPGSSSAGFLYARPRKRSKHMPLQLLVGHIDTVWPVGTLKTMPFAYENNKIKGPGVYDMKAGITQIFYAIKAIISLNLEPEVLPVIIFNSDEETGSRDSTVTLKRLARISSRAFILEPPLGLDGKLKTSRKGIGRFSLTILGKASHAGLKPEEGVSSILELSYQIQKLHALNDTSKGISVNVGMIEGGISANMVAPESRAVIDVRVFDHKSAHRISRQILTLKPIQEGIEIKVSGGFGRPPMEYNERNKKLWHHAKMVGGKIGLNLNHGRAGGASDGNTTSQYTATLDGLGTPGDGAHAIHEYAFKDQLVKRTELLTLLVLSPPISPIKNELES